MAGVGEDVEKLGPVHGRWGRAPGGRWGDRLAAPSTLEHCVTPQSHPYPQKN